MLLEREKVCVVWWWLVTSCAQELYFEIARERRDVWRKSGKTFLRQWNTYVGERKMYIDHFNF